MHRIRYLSPNRLKKALIREYRAFSHALRSRYFIRYFRKDLTDIRQKPMCLNIFCEEVKDYSGIIDFFSREKVMYFEGKHTIYVPPQKAFFEITGISKDLYPPNSGFKFIKNFKPLNRASYLIDGYRQPVERAMLGRLENQADAANILHCFGLGPQLHDLVEVHSSQFKTGCFVVQHINSVTPSYDEWSAFMRMMRNSVENLNGALVLARPEKWNHSDFEPPSCGGNLLKRVADGKLFYVDFQQFIVVDKAAIIKSNLDDSAGLFHFGNTRRVLSSSRYLYQSVPGIKESAKRDVQKRWMLYRAMLRNAGISLRNRSILDICCNAGMFMSLALGESARLALGWDLPEVIAQAKRLQLLLGNTRALFFPAQLNTNYYLSKDIPVWAEKTIKGCIVFYLAAWRHIGFMSHLAEIPWRALVYEGHQEDTREETVNNCRKVEILWKCKLINLTTLTDGDSGSRPVALFTRD